MPEQLRLDLRALSITRGILSFEPVRRLVELLDAMADSRDAACQIEAAGAYAASLLPYGLEPEKAILAFLSHDKNAYAEGRLAGSELPGLKDILDRELQILSRAAAVSPDDVAAALGNYAGCLPTWRPGAADLAPQYYALLDAAGREGFGMYRGNIMFALGRRRIYPVSHPDPVRLSDLHGYERQRDIILRNTRLLLAGGSASNVLLYGDSGTGKSTTVKAVANELAPEGLRLIEVKKSQIHRMPRLAGELAREPLKFIIFIDDLSFTQEDDDFGSLKAILEGSVQSRAQNIVIYATSNRRRLIKETFSDRDGDDIHANETVQQKTALSDRFGITLPFMNPKKDVYLEMVRKLAAETDLSEEELFAGAERYALEKGGRSGRVARQFVEQLALGR